MILKDRIKSLSLPDVSDSMIDIISRKAVSISGDIRTALKIFQNALELIKINNNKINNNNQSMIETTSASAVVTEIISTQNEDKTLSFRQIVELVNKATSNFKNSPPYIMLQNLCKLDQLIMLVICKNIRLTGGVDEITIQLIWERLNDIIYWAHNKNLNIIVIPPIEIFYIAINRLLELDLIGIVTQSNHNLGSPGMNTIMNQFYRPGSKFDISCGVKFIKPRQEYGDILKALELMVPPNPYIGFVTMEN